MTLFKQVALTVSLINIIMLGSVMYINYDSAKQDMLQTLYETTVNNISTLSSELSEGGEDNAYIKTIIDAEFDSGYFKSIEYELNNGTFQYIQIDNNPVEGVPLWFIDFTNIKLEKIKKDVSSGWNILGKVQVLGDTNIVYQALYKMFIKLLYLFVISLTVSLMVFSILLHYVLKPLKGIQSQAEAILQNKFIIVKKEPYTTEFKDVVKGMNLMVKKVEDIFEKANESAKRNQELLYSDPVTKLFNRRYLMIKLPELIQHENRENGGISLFISLNSIEIINKIIGQREAQEFLQGFSRILNNSLKEYEERLIARVNDMDFIVVLPSCKSQDIDFIVTQINEEFTQLRNKNNIDKDSLFLNLGLYKYKSTTKVEELLTKTDTALLNAVAQEQSNSYFYEDSTDIAFGKNQWHSIISDAIANNKFELKFWTTMDSSSKKLIHKVMTFSINADNNEEYSFGDFIAPAINFGLVSEIYNVVLKDIFSNTHKELENSVCSIRLSNEFMKDVNSLGKLSELFDKKSKNLNFKLYFEVSNSFAINNRLLVKSFVTLFEKYNFSFGINSFTAESSDYTYLKELNPSFLKADTIFLLDQSKESMSALQVITDSLGIDIIATFVNSQEKIKLLGDNKITIIQGPATDSLEIK